MADKAKLLKLAQKHLSKGNLDKAIITFQQLVDVDPRDQRLLLRLAELQARGGRKKEAIQNYEKIAAEYIKHDFTPKAIAVYKTILRLDPELLTAYEKLTELYKSQGLEAEALSQLENLFTVYENKKDEAKQIEVLKLMVEMDPENLGFQVRRGEMLAKKGMKQEAAEAFAKAATTLSRRGFHDRASQLFEKIINLNPGNIAVRKELCAHYLESGQFSEAQREIEAILELEPDDPRMVLLLGRILFQLGKKREAEERIAHSINLFLHSGELEGVMREYLFVAQSHLRNGEVDEAEVYYRQIKKAVPDESHAIKGLVSIAEARKDRVAQIQNLVLLGRTHQQKGDGKAALKAYEKVLELDSLNEEAKNFIESGFDPSAEAMGEEDGVPAVDDELQPGELEGVEEAELLPDDVVEPREEADEVGLEELEDSDLEEVGQHESAAGEEDELPDIILEDFEDDIEVEFEAVIPESIDAGVSAPEDEESVDDLLVEVEVYQRYGLQEKVAETLERVRSMASDDPEVMERIQSFVDEPVIPTSSVEPSPSVETIDIPEADEDLEQEIGVADTVEGVNRAVQPEISEHDPFQEDLEEAEFYLSQGLEEEAQRIYRSILKKSPGHPLAAQALGMDGDTEPSVEKPPEAAGQETIGTQMASNTAGGLRSKLIVEDMPAEDAEGFLDLADELRTELSEEFEHAVEPGPQDGPVTFEEIFAQFKKGIEETLGEEEYETHYNLGIAYKDMGLFDDALREFEVGSRDPDLVQDSLSLMAMCFIEKKDYDSAVKTVQKAIEVSTEGNRAGLYYQLGEAFEKKKNWPEALAAYSEVQSRDPSFEGIEDILVRVRSHIGLDVPEEEIETPLESGMDDMLSDLIREVEEMAKESSGEPVGEPGKTKKDRISYL